MLDFTKLMEESILNRILACLISIFFGMFINMSALNHRIQINFHQVDSVIIKTICPTCVTLGGMCFDRQHFDEAFAFHQNQQRKGEWYYNMQPIYKIELRQWKEIAMIISIINLLEPLPEDKVSIYPVEIKSNPGVDWRYPLRPNSTSTNDPIETRTKISIYLKSGEVIVAFASPTLLDINNYRYKAYNFTRLLELFTEGIDSDYDK